MRRIDTLGLFLIFLMIAVWPLANVLAAPKPIAVRFQFIAFFNLIGWSLALALFLARQELRRAVGRLAKQFGIDSRFRSFEAVTSALLRDVERKNSAFLPNLLERRIVSREELSRTLEHIVNHAYQLLNAESAELALFDKESGLYHSSFVLGKPFRKSAQAMLSGALEDSSENEQDLCPDVLIEPLAFGGTVLGSIRVGLRRGWLPSQSDREIMHLLAMQGSLAIINAQYTEELKRMRRASEESIKVKTGFLANLSHEIRAPLGIMLNAVELVLDGLCGPINDDQLETLKMVRSNGEHLLELINDVLDYAKVESGKIVPNPAEIVVNDLLKDLAGVIRTQAEAKNHKVVVRSMEEVLTVFCDRRHIRQMLINLLTNAVKYTPEGGLIEMWAERIPGNKIKLSVKDNGVGIEEADRAKVFAPFERLQNAYSLSQVGTGLGMSLTKRLAEVNGGVVDFKSSLGEGSHFWLIFKAVEYNPAAVEENFGEKPHAKGRGELILVVESDIGERKMLARYLTHIGFKVAAIANKLEFGHYLREHKVDLVILDNKIIDNPEEDLLKHVRDDAKSAHLPLIVLSSRAFVFDIEKYLKAGVDRCLSKPVSLKELGLICRSLIDGDCKEETIGAEDGSSRSQSKEKDEKAIKSHSRLIRVDDVLH